jgi:hypothetical protein
MRFVIRRTSGGTPPCAEAFEASFVRLDSRTWPSPEAITDLRTKETWFSEGKNHRIENNSIVREFDDKEWFVELRDMNDLMGFIAKHGEVAIGPAWRNYKLVQIEIIDDYRD